MEGFDSKQPSRPNFITTNYLQITNCHFNYVALF
jgi:hypothetical protein